MERIWLHNQRIRSNLSEDEIAKRMFLPTKTYMKIESGEYNRLDPILIGMLSILLNVDPVAILDMEAKRIV